jgi:ASPIC and UnbV/FG-GAP-like repeat
MSAPALAAPGGRALTIRGTPYPVLLPTLRDPRLHLAAVIVSLQILGQAAFDFRLSIAQILISLATCAVLESAIAFVRQRVIMWPASALLTGNGVAFILRVPGTEHGDWWSLHGWWIFAATAAVSLLSKHVIRPWGARSATSPRGGHIFNPSNIGLVLCFLVLGSGRAEPLDFWWGPMSTWLALALIIIVGGGLAILLRLHLLVVAVGFWLAFAAGIGLLAAIGHAMTARWHAGPITGGYFWWVLVTSPEILVFLFFMITDPKTIPKGTRARAIYAVSVGLLAALLIAPARTEYWSKVAVLGALAIVCGLRPLLERLPAVSIARRRLAVAAAVGLVAYTGAVAASGVRARPEATAAPLAHTVRLPAITIGKSKRVETKLDLPAAQRIARDLVADLRLQSAALSARRAKTLARAAIGDELTRLEAQIRDAGGATIDVPTYRLDRMLVWLEAGRGQGPAIAVARLDGSRQLATYADTKVVRRGDAAPFRETLELQEDQGRWLVAHLRGAPPVTAATPSPSLQRAAGAAFSGVRLTDVARQVGLDFRHAAFRFGVTPDTPAMMGGGLCWLDYDNDGWLDLFVVNSYSESDIGLWDKHGGLPTSALFRNDHGTFENVTASSGAGLAVRGQGCVAADLNGDGHTDLFVTTALDDQLLWNNGDGTFTEGARAAGVVSVGWHAGAAVGDVNGDGRPDLFVAGYTEANGAIPGSSAGFPTNHLAVRDLLFVNTGNGADGRAHFREAGRRAGIDPPPYDHSLGAVFTDLNGDGRLDLYVANDEDPNRYYVNVLAPGLGFRFVDRAGSLGLADRNAGMGIADGDYTRDGRPDLFVSNSRGQTHAVFRSRGASFADARPAFSPVFGPNFTGWGDSWVDLNNDGRLDLVVANGEIPVKNLAKDARSVQVLGNVYGRYVDAGALLGLAGVPWVNGRGLAAADFDNDGHVDVAVNSVGGPLLLLRSTGGRGHWLEVKLPRFAPGAVVTAVLPDGRRLVQEVHAGSSYLSSEDPRVHFGLGTATRVAELTVRYPGGYATRLRDVAADRIVTARP